MKEKSRKKEVSTEKENLMNRQVSKVLRKTGQHLVFGGMILCMVGLLGCGGKGRLSGNGNDDILMMEDGMNSNGGGNSALGGEVGKDGDLTAGGHLAEGGDLTSDGNKIVVHIVGAVECPGVYRLDWNSRVADLIESAGGYTEDACESWINQARLLSDGEQIYVPTKEEVDKWQKEGEADAPVESGQEDVTSGKNDRIDINKATVEELMNLPGIGESKAKSIVEYRQANGRFASIEDLMLIPGIKEGIYNQIKDYIKV